MASEKCCGGRTGEKICRARYCVPLSIIIIAVHFALWWYVIYPRLISSSSEDPLLDKSGAPTEFGPGYSDTAYLNSEDSSGAVRENYDTASRESTTTSQTTSDEYGGMQSSSVENLRQETRPREVSRHHRYRHRNHNHRHLYVVRRKKPLNFGFSSTTPTPSYYTDSRRILDNVNTRTQQPYQQQHHQQQQQQQYPWGSRTLPPSTTSSTYYSPSTTVNPTMLLTNFVAHVTAKTTTRHHITQHQQHKHRQHHHHQHHSSTPAPPTTPAPTITPQFRHHHHFEKERNEELQRQREILEREKERREQERMKQLTEERAKLRLTEEQERRAQAIYESQQRALKERKEEEIRKKVMEEESRRRQEHERKLKQWNFDDDEQPAAPPRRLPPAVVPSHESNQWHHPRLEDRQQQRQQQRPQQKSAETVADPWAHLRQIEEQRSTSYTVAPATRSPGGAIISNEIDPFSITSHRIEEANGVWRGNVDPQNLHPNAISHERHQQQHHKSGERHHPHRQHPHQQQQQGPQPPQRPSEADTRRKMIEEKKQRQQEYEKRMQEWNRQNQARQQTTPPPNENSIQQQQQPPQHHHHTLQGSILPHQVHHGHHSHQSHEQKVQSPQAEEISNEIAPATPASKEKRDTAPVIVTALLDIGRGDWFTFTRPYDLYLNYLLDLLKLQNRIIIYGDRQVLEFLEQNKESIDFDRIQFVELSLDDLPYSRYRNEIKEIMDEEQKEWKKGWEKATKTHPEAINPDYNILVNSKPYLLFNATQISKFESEYFIWIDAGYSHGEKNIIPTILWNPVLPPGRITVIKITPDQDKVTNYAIEHVYRKAWTVMSGGVLAGDISTIDRFHRFYYKTFMDLLDARKTDDDQTTLLMTVVNYHSIFNILTGGWFDAFKLLPSQ